MLLRALSDPAFELTHVSLVVIVNDVPLTLLLAEKLFFEHAAVNNL